MFQHEPTSDHAMLGLNHVFLAHLCNNSSIVYGDVL